MSAYRASAKSKPRDAHPEPFQFRGQLIEPDRQYLPDELRILLGRSRNEITTMCTDYSYKKASLKTILSEDGRKVVSGSDIISYLKNREKKSHLAGREKVFIPHDVNPSLHLYASVILETDPERIFSQMEAVRILCINQSQVRNLLTSIGGKPPRCEPILCDDGITRLSGKSIISIARKLAELPVQKAFVKDILVVLLLDRADSLYAKIYREDGKAWFRYICKKSHKELYYPVYYDLCGNIILDKKHLSQIKKDCSNSNSNVVTINEVCSLTGVKRSTITTSFWIDDSSHSSFYTVKTLFHKFDIPVFRPYNGQVHFGKTEFEEAKKTKESENSHYILVPELVARLAAEGKEVSEESFREFIHSRTHIEMPGTKNEKRVCKLKLGKQEVFVDVLQSHNLVGNPLVFNRSDTETILRSLNFSAAVLNARNINYFIRGILDQVGKAAYSKLLGELKKDASGDTFFSFGEFGKIAVLPYLGNYRISKNDAEFVHFYFYMKYAIGTNLAIVLHKFEDGLAGKTIVEMENDPRLKKKLRLMQHVVSGLSPEVVEILSTASRSLRFINSKTLPLDICKIGEYKSAPALYLANNFIPLPYVTAGDYLVMSKEDGLLYTLFVQGLDHIDEGTFYQKFMKFSAWLTSDQFDNYGRQHVFALAIFRYYHISGMDVLRHGLEIGDEWSYASLFENEFKRLDSGTISIRLGKLSKAFLSFNAG